MSAPSARTDGAWRYATTLGVLQFGAWRYATTLGALQFGAWRYATTLGALHFLFQFSVQQ